MAGWQEFVNFAAQKWRAVNGEWRVGFQFEFFCPGITQLPKKTLR